MKNVFIMLSSFVTNLIRWQEKKYLVTTKKLLVIKRKMLSPANYIIVSTYFFSQSIKIVVSLVMTPIPYHEKRKLLMAKYKMLSPNTSI